MIFGNILITYVSLSKIIEETGFILSTNNIPKPIIIIEVYLPKNLPVY